MCEVCCEPFNLSNHKRVSCPYCPFQSCAECTGKYLLDTPDDPHCMACRRGWSREILCNNMTSKFVTQTLKARREAVLFERERSLMPATQPHVEAEKKRRHYEALCVRGRAQIRQLDTELHKCNNQNLAVLAATMGASTEFEALLERGRQTIEIEKKMREIELNIKFWTFCMNAWIRPQTVERRQFVRACPVTDCKGFLSTAWKCGLCENWTCPDCHEVRGLDKEGPHTCDPNNIATAQMLAKDSRNCPKCAACIFKIEGCDQMWCTQCQTAFSWSRGTIEKGRVHNPHYYDYMRGRGNLPREPGDVVCGGLPSWLQVSRLTEQAQGDMRVIGAIHRMHGHIQYVVMNRYATNALEDNRDIRIKFMIGDFTDEIFKKKLQQREKAQQKKTEIRQVLEMYNTVTVDLFQAFLTHKKYATVMEEFERLREHVNTELRAISRRYTNCAVPLIQETWTVY